VRRSLIAPGHRSRPLRRREWQSANSGRLIGDRREAIGPIMPAAGDDPDAIWLDMNHQAITVPFDFVEPIIRLAPSTSTKQGTAPSFPAWDRTEAAVDQDREACAASRAMAGRCHGGAVGTTYAEHLSCPDVQQRTVKESIRISLPVLMGNCDFAKSRSYFLPSS
jgi:hypothetical protein